MRTFVDDEPGSIRCVAVECRPLHCPAAAEDAPEQPAPEDVQPPGTRVLASSFKPDGSRYRPGERLARGAVGAQLHFHTLFAPPGRPQTAARGALRAGGRRHGQPRACRAAKHV